jgi:PAS domain S-box-containing protein
VNNAAVEHYGYSREEFRRLTLADIRTTEEFERFERALEESRTKGAKFEGRFQTKHRKKNAEVIDVDIRYTDIVYNGRRSLLGVIIDVTERGRVEQERERLIAELQRSNGSFNSLPVLPRDLQEPLRTVSSYVDLLAMKYKGGSTRPRTSTFPLQSKARTRMSG